MRRICLAPLPFLAALLLALPSIVGAQQEQELNYRLDASASEVTARVPFFGLSSKTARFPRMEGRVTIVPGAPERAVVDVTFDAVQIEAPDETTLRRLRGEKFFCAERGGCGAPAHRRAQPDRHRQTRRRRLRYGLRPGRGRPSAGRAALP